MVSPPLKRGMTAAAFQSLGISDDTNFEDNFRKRGSRLSRTADLFGSRFCSSFRRTAIWIWVKEKLGWLGQVAAGGVELLADVGVARRKAWPAVEKCLLKSSIIVDLSVVTLLPSLSAVGSWEEVLLFSMDFTVSQNFLEQQDANFCLKKASLGFSYRIIRSACGAR